MLTPLILFLGLTVATAVIAYWSDNLGKKLGKKRVSLFGLRPRTTATVLTITSSWAIMLFTLLALLIVVPSLRRALFRYDKDRAQYRKDIDKAQSQLTSTRDRLKQTQESISSTRNQLVEARKSLEEAKGDVEDARQDVEKAQKSAKSAQEGEKKALLGVASARNKAALAQQRVVAAQERVNAAQSRFEAAQGRFEAAQSRYLSARTRANSALQREESARIGERQAEQKASLARQSLGTVQKSLETAQTDLKAAETNLARAKLSYGEAKQSALKATEATLKAEAETLKLERQKAQLLRELDFLDRYALQLDMYATTLERNNVEIPVGRTFAAGIIESGKSPARIEENLRQLLAKGRDALGKIPFTLPPDASLALLPLPEIVDGKLVFREGDEALKRLADEIAKSTEPTSVRVVAARNIPMTDIWNDDQPREKILIDARIVAVRVATAFKSGDVLASVVIDGTSGDASIFNKLQILTDDGRAVAVQRKVNPPQSPQEPYFYASGTNVALFAALRRIEATGKVVQVKLVAADDLSTVEPLRVRFEIEGESAAPSVANISQ